MPQKSWPCIFVGASVLFTAAGLIPNVQLRAAEPCGQEEICGLKNPEDMIRIADTHWALVSRLARDPQAAGGFSLVDLDRRVARPLSPDVSKPAAAQYAACPSAPKASDLITHGLDIHRLAGGRNEIFAVNHGGRQSVEVFDLEVSDRSVSLSWKGCVIIPAEVSANAVAALPDGLAVTSFGSSGDQGTADLLAGNPTGFVTRWTPKKGWVRVPTSEFGGDNGVAAAADGSVLYVNDWSDGTLRIVPLNRGVASATIKLGDFHPDNVHSLGNGNLVIAGQIGAASDIMGCASQSACAVGSMIVIVDPKRGSVVSRQSVAATATFGAAATALQDGKDFWLSSFRGDRIVRVESKPDP